MSAPRRLILTLTWVLLAVAGPGSAVRAADFPSSFSHEVLEAGKIFNFLVVVGVLVYLLWAPLRKFFRGRTQEIQRQLADAEAARIDALRKLNLMEERLLALDDEIREIKEQAKADAVAESERILQQAEVEAVRIQTRGQTEIETMKQQAMSELRRFVAEEAGRTAEEILRREMTPEAEERLVERFLTQMGDKR